MKSKYRLPLFRTTEEFDAGSVFPTGVKKNNKKKGKNDATTRNL